jgi:hypothetical protein
MIIFFIEEDELQIQGLEEKNKILEEKNKELAEKNRKDKLSKKHRKKHYLNWAYFSVLYFIFDWCKSKNLLLFFQKFTLTF